MLSCFRFDETVKEKFMNSLSIDEANEAITTASAKLEAFKAQKKASEKRKGKKKFNTEGDGAWPAVELEMTNIERARLVPEI